MIINPTTKFKKDLKLIEKRGWEIEHLTKVLETLASGSPLDSKYLDHPLVGNYKNYRECHVENDWLLIYQIDAAQDTLILVRTGSHSDLY